MEKLLVRPSEAADLLGLGRSKVYAMIASGELPSVKIGKSIRVPVEELRQWVHGRVSESTSLLPLAEPTNPTAVAR